MPNWCSNRATITGPAPVIKEMENHYIQTTTGITPVNAGSIKV